MTDLEILIGALNQIRCAHHIEEEDGLWQNEGEPESKKVAMCLSVSQTHFYFDKQGRFLGTVSDEMGYFSRPVESEADACTLAKQALEDAMTDEMADLKDLEEER